MSGSIPPTSKMRRALAAGALTVALAVGMGAGPAAAGDQHSGGVSGGTKSIDIGNPDAEVLGESISRDEGGGFFSFLPFTGSDLLGLAAIGGLAVVIGIGAAKISKRRASMTA